MSYSRCAGTCSVQPLTCNLHRWPHPLRYNSHIVRHTDDRPPHRRNVAPLLLYHTSLSGYSSAVPYISHPPHTCLHQINGRVIECTYIVDSAVCIISLMVAVQLVWLVYAVRHTVTHRRVVDTPAVRPCCRSSTVTPATSTRFSLIYARVICSRHTCVSMLRTRTGLLNSFHTSARLIRRDSPDSCHKPTTEICMMNHTTSGGRSCVSSCMTSHMRNCMEGK